MVVLGLAGGKRSVGRERKSLRINLAGLETYLDAVDERGLEHPVPCRVLLREMQKIPGEERRSSSYVCEEGR